MRQAAPRASLSSKESPPKRGERVERQSNFKVVVRVRPPLPRELSGELPFQNIIAVDDREQVITISENVDKLFDERGSANMNASGMYSSHNFAFDHVYDQEASQKKVYETTARGVVDSALQGYNATIFAYGQTGTGKTFTMEGFNESTTSMERRGIIPRAIEQIFGHIQQNASPSMRFLVRASYLQIYNEQISDLLKPERSNLSIREDKRRGVFVDGLSEWVVRSPAEIYGLMQRGGQVRATGETKMNEVSSRSHAVFIVIAEQSETVYVDQGGKEMSPEEFQKFMHGRGVRRTHEMNKLEDHVRQSFKVGKLNLVDLAGSERVRLSGATGQRLEESKQINRSLSALGNVISALTDTKGRSHVPYRDSKLTRMLEDSLGGNCRTTMMAMISPALEAMVESLSTLKFANRAKNIKNEARVNEDLDQKSLLRKYERELKKLRAELEARSKNVVDKRRLLELDEQRRRAEADKMVAIRALEARSIEFMHEKEEKKRLEQRIAMLMGQMIKGDKPAGEVLQISMGGISEQGMLDGIAGAVPEVQILMKEQQERLRQEYDGKLAEIERERETIEEEKAQVDRYKQLLLKQRDIMIALTQRLVERDEQIMALQDELDAYDRHHKELEEKLDEKTALLIKFQRIALEVHASSPSKNDELTEALESWNNLGVKTDGSGATEIGGVEDGLGSARSSSDQIDRLVSDDTDHVHTNITTSDSSSNTPRKVVESEEEKMEKLQSIEDAVAMEMEIHLSRLENEAGIRQGLRQPMSSLLRQVSTLSSLIMTTIVMIRKLTQPPALHFTPSLFIYSTLYHLTYISIFQVFNRVRSTKAEKNVDDMLSDVQRLVNEKQSLASTVEELQRQAQNGGDSSGGAAMESLRTRCEHLVREREAVHTIMEQKIKVLVQSIARSAGGVLQNNGMAPGPDSAGNALSKDVAALQRLVNASIAALKNAASGANAPPPVPGQGGQQPQNGKPDTQRGVRFNM